MFHYLVQVWVLPQQTSWVQPETGSRGAAWKQTAGKFSPKTFGRKSPPPVGAAEVPICCAQSKVVMWQFGKQCKFVKIKRSYLVYYLNIVCVCFPLLKEQWECGTLFHVSDVRKEINNLKCVMCPCMNSVNTGSMYIFYTTTLLSITHTVLSNSFSSLWAKPGYKLETHSSSLYAGMRNTHFTMIAVYANNLDTC